MRGLSQFNSHIGAFLLGALLSGVFFAGQLSDSADVTFERSQELASAVFLADVEQSDILKLVRDEATFAFKSATTTYASTTVSLLTEDEVATSSASTTDEIREAVVEGEELVIEEDVQEEGVVFQMRAEIAASDEEANGLSAEEVLARAEEVLSQIGEKETEEEQSGERVLPDGVYLLANGDYVDKNGDKIIGDPFLYNYKPPPEEELFETPGGVVMDRFGVIHFAPDVVDESKVLIPPTIIDLDNPPATISPIYIPRYVMTSMNQNPFLNCTQLQLYANDRALCELYKERGDDYEWIRVDEIGD